MTIRIVCLSLAAALAACSGATLSGPPATQGARIEVLAEGGFAGFSIKHVVNHDDRSFLYVRRRLCNQNCGAPMDSVTGVLSRAAADSLFNLVLAQDPFSLKDDYGPTPGGADMYLYTVRIAADGRTKSVRFDNGTMPAPMQRILSALETTVSDARR